VRIKVIAATLGYAIGIMLILSGVVIPASTLIESLRTIPETLREQLILGATLFKVGLVLDGLFVMTLWWLITRKVVKQNSRGVSDRRSTSTISILIGILLTAFLLRLYNLNFGIWFDEIVTYVSYMDRSFGEILTTYDNQNNHLLYTILARLSFLTFGESVWSLRFPAVLFGVGSIWVLYLFSCEVATSREGLLSAGFLTFSYHHLWFSQNARGYTALLFWTILSSLLLIRAVREAKIGLWLMYGITASLGMMTHVTMAFVVVAQGIVYLNSLYDSAKADRREKWLGGCLGIIVFCLFTFQFYSLVLPQLFQWQGKGVSSWQGTVSVVPWKSPIWMLGELVNILKISASSGALFFLAMSVFCAGLVDFARKKSPLVILLTVPVLVGIIVIVSLGSTLLPRLFFFAMGFGVVILVRGLMLCGNFLSRGLQFQPRRAHVMGAGLCVCAIIVSGISVAKAYLPKQDYEGALEFVQNQRQPGDIILTVGLTVLPYQQFYKLDWRNVRTLADLDKPRSRGTRTWLVYTMPVVLQAAYPEIMKRIKVDYKVVKEFPGTLSGGDIVVAVARS
jgi:mannosyltransferase